MWKRNDLFVINLKYTISLTTQDTADGRRQSTHAGSRTLATWRKHTEWKMEERLT